MKTIPDAPTTTPQRKEKSAVYIYFVTHCGSCEWTAPDLRQMESDSWSDLAAHTRKEHGGNCREVRIRRTVIEEIAEEQE